MYFKYKYFFKWKEQIHCFSFSFWYTHYITWQHQLDLSHKFMIFLSLSTVDRGNKSPAMNVTRASVSRVWPASVLLYFLGVPTNDVRVGCVCVALGRAQASCSKALCFLCKTHKINKLLSWQDETNNIFFN